MPSAGFTYTHTFAYTPCAHTWGHTQFRTPVDGSAGAPLPSSELGHLGRALRPGGFVLLQQLSEAPPAPVRQLGTLFARHGRPAPRPQPGPGGYTLRARSHGGAFGVAHRALASHSPPPDGRDLRQQKGVGPSCANSGARRVGRAESRGRRPDPLCSGTASWKVQRKMRVKRPEQRPVAPALPLGAASKSLHQGPPSARRTSDPQSAAHALQLLTFPPQPRPWALPRPLPPIPDPSPQTGDFRRPGPAPKPPPVLCLAPPGSQGPPAQPHLSE